MFSFAQPSKYSATARILLRTVADDNAGVIDPNAVVPFFADRQLKNAAQVLESTNTRAAVKAAYHGHLNVNDVTAVPLGDGSDAIDISVTGGDPRDTANLVNLYARTYLTLSTTASAETLQAGEATIQKQIADLDAQRAAISAPLDAV